MAYRIKVIDRDSGKRVEPENSSAIKKRLKEKDPILVDVEKKLDAEEHSPMNPPEAYDRDKIIEIDIEKAPPIIQKLMEEHKVSIQKIAAFEKALLNFKKSDYQINSDINDEFRLFFHFFDHSILEHTLREEKQLFPILNEKLLESGEHGKGDEKYTAIDVMEDDHVKFIQLGTLTFNMLGLAARLPNAASKQIVYDVAFENGRELIEILKLHIYRENHIIFPLAIKLINEKEFSSISKPLFTKKSVY